MYDDILGKRAFKDFFAAGTDFDPNFSYEVSFGLIPREFLDTPEDRYIYEEENDVTEIYFIMKGEWAVAFDSFTKFDDEGFNFADETIMGTRDMTSKGIFIA